jgi:hypothetical protein
MWRVLSSEYPDGANYHAFSGKLLIIYGSMYHMLQGLDGNLLTRIHLVMMVYGVDRMHLGLQLPVQLIRP